MTVITTLVPPGRKRGRVPQDLAVARGEDHQPEAPRRPGAGLRDRRGHGRDRIAQRAVGGHRPRHRRAGNPAARPVEEPGGPGRPAPRPRHPVGFAAARGAGRHHVRGRAGLRHRAGALDRRPAGVVGPYRRRARPGAPGPMACRRPADPAAPVGPVPPDLPAGRAAGGRGGRAVLRRRRCCPSRRTARCRPALHRVVREPGPSIRTPCPPRAGSWTRSRPSIRISGG